MQVCCYHPMCIVIQHEWLTGIELIAFCFCWCHYQISLVTATWNTTIFVDRHKCRQEEITWWQQNFCWVILIVNGDKKKAKSYRKQLTVVWTSKDMFLRILRNGSLLVTGKTYYGLIGSSSITIVALTWDPCTLLFRSCECFYFFVINYQWK